MAAADQLFKEAIHEFLPQFFELFLPEIGHQIDWERGVIFREQEYFTDFPAGALHEPDSIAEVHSRSGEPELILVHTEILGKREGRFPFRMWQYYSLLRNRTALPVFPLVIYLTPGAGDSRWEEYEESLLGERLLYFRYAVISLPDMAADDWQNRPGIAGALAAALAALMRPGEISRARLKFDGLVRAASGEVNEARRVILATILETYLPLASPAESAEFSELMTANTSAEGIEEMLISPYEERGIQKGLEQGLQRGQQQVVLRQLRLKFGELPEAVIARIQALTDSEELLLIADRILTAQTLEEIGLS